MHALQCARQEITTTVSELLAQKEIASRVPRNAELKIEPGDKVRIYRETDKTYVGLYPIIRVDGKKLFVVIMIEKYNFVSMKP